MKIIAYPTDGLEIKWADHPPAKHSHRTNQVREFTDSVSDDGEICLWCGVCETHWHTDILEVTDEEDEREFTIRDLVRAATEWMERQQLPLPFEIPVSSKARMHKRHYTPRASVKPTAYVGNLFAVAA